MHSSSQSTIHDENGWGMGVTVDRDVASSWETFRLWRVSDSEFQLRTSQWQSLTWDDERMAWGIRLLFPHLSYLLSAATSIPSHNKPIIISTAHVSITFHLHVYIPNFQIPIIHHSFPTHAYHHTLIIHFSYHFISSPIHHLFPHSSTISNPLRVSQEQEILRTHSPMSSLIPFIYYSSNSDKWPMHAWSFWLLQKPSTDVFPFPNSLYLPILPPLHSKLMNPLNPETGSAVETVQERLRGCHQ